MRPTPPSPLRSAALDLLSLGWLPVVLLALGSGCAAAVGGSPSADGGTPPASAPSSNPTSTPSSFTDTTPPTAPTGVTLSPQSSSAILVTWHASTDDVGVTGYTIFRDNREVSSVGGGTLSFEDTGLTASTSYSYTLKARDAAGNLSPASGPVSARTLPSGGAGTGSFRVSGTKILDPDGKDFVIKGVNVNGYEWVWNDSTVGNLSNIADCWKFNAIRVNNSLKQTAGVPHWSTNDDLDAIIQAFTARKVVVILEAHDWTCDYPSGSDLTLLKSWLTDLATRYKSNPYVWLEPLNEPGGGADSATQSQWVGTYQDLISTIRAAGATSPIVVDGTNCGQEGGYVPVDQLAGASAILSWGKQLQSFGGQTYDNVLFSYHVYEQWNDNQNGTSADRMGRYLDLVAAQGLAVFCGEYGVQNVNYSTGTAVRGLYQAAVPRGIGRMAWHWSGGAGDNHLTISPNGGGGADIDSCTAPSNLTSCEGQAAWQDTHGSASPACVP